MNQMPTQPRRDNSLSMNVTLGSSATVEDIMEGLAKIQAKYPDVKPSEVSIDTASGGWDSDPETDYELNFHRWVENPNYEAQMALYHQALAEYHKAEHELQMRYNAEYRSRVEQQNAKTEYKKARRAERIANRVTPIGMEKCE